MNTYSFIPHRLFVAAVSGGRKAPQPPPGQSLRVVVETDAAPAVPMSDAEHRRDVAPTLALRRALQLGTGAGI